MAIDKMFDEILDDEILDLVKQHQSGLLPPKENNVCELRKAYNSALKVLQEFMDTLGQKTWHKADQEWQLTQKSVEAWISVPTDSDNDILYLKEIYKERVDVIERSLKYKQQRETLKA